jgi:5'-3' exonuclease
MAHSFSDMIPKKVDDTVLIVDALNLAFRWKHQGRSDFRYEYQKTVESLANSYKCGKVIIAADQGSSSYRKEVYPGYKQGRKDKFADQTPEEKAFFEEFFSEYEETLALLSESYTVLRYQGVEADDIAAHLVKNKNKYGLENIWLISSDKDWDLLIQPNVNRFSYVTRKEITADNWFDHYEVDQQSYITLKCLQGDAGDSVPGVPGVGPKRALGIIQEYGDVFSIHDSLPLPGKQKFIQNLNEFGDDLLRNCELMDLLTYCDDAIGVDNLQDIEEKLTNEN